MVTSIWAWSKLIHSGPGSCATKLHNWTETMSFSYPWNKPWMQMISFYLPTCFLFTNIVIIDFFGRGKRFEYINLSDALFIHHFNISRRARSCLMMTVWGSEAPYSPALAAMGPLYPICSQCSDTSNHETGRQHRTGHSNHLFNYRSLKRNSR